LLVSAARRIEAAATVGRGTPVVVGRLSGRPSTQRPARASRAESIEMGKLLPSRLKQDV
jgi:hypothetical protein